MLKKIQIFDIWEQSSGAYSGFSKVSHFSQKTKLAFSIKILNDLQLLANRSMVHYCVTEHFKPGVKNVMQPLCPCNKLTSLQFLKKLVTKILSAALCFICTKE